MVKKNLIILDADFLLFTATMGNKVLDKEGNPIKIDNKFVYTDRTEEEVYKAADIIITNILNISKANYYIGYLGGQKSFRYDVNPEYKANRKDLVKPKFLSELRYYLKAKWDFIYTTNGLEADDAVNIAKNLFIDEFNCIIVSSDKDLIKSIKGNYINSRDFKFINTSKEQAEEFFWRSMITGDAIDNIRGIPSKGDKFVDKLFTLDEDKRLLVFGAYLNFFNNEEEAICSFYKNYKCLKILDSFEDFEIPTLNEYKGKVLQEPQELELKWEKDTEEVRKEC